MKKLPILTITDDGMYLDDAKINAIKDYTISYQGGEKGQPKRMTLNVTVLIDPKILVGHLGDSRGSDRLDNI